jgi:hypothetical protein
MFRSATAQVIHFIGANDCLVREVLHYKDLLTPSGLQVSRPVPVYVFRRDITKRLNWIF